jgi:hypothetical protein
LSGKDRKPGGQRAAYAIAGHLALFHAFEQRGLGARRHAIDFVDQQQGGKHRPRVEAERVAAGSKDRGSEDIGRHQVRSRLDALAIQPQQPSKRFDDQRFGDTGYPFHQGVALAQQGHQHFLDDAPLAGDHVT